MPLKWQYWIQLKEIYSKLEKNIFKKIKNVPKYKQKNLFTLYSNHSNMIRNEEDGMGYVAFLLQIR